MSILAKLYNRFNHDVRVNPDVALQEARERLDGENARSQEIKLLTNRAIKSRERNGYGEALKKALRGK